MKKKSPQVKVPLKKIVFFSLIVALAGFALLFFSIAFGGKTPKTPAPPAPAEKPSESIPPDSVPQKPQPSKPAPAEPAPAEPGPQKPQPSEPAPVKPSPGEQKPAAPSKPAPERPKPHPAQPQPAEPAPQKPVPAAPQVPSPAKKSGKLIFIFDDAGNSLRQINPFISLPFPITIAVLPGLADSKATADSIRKAGKEVFLHQPMQAVNRAINPGPGSIQPEMSTGEAARIVHANIAQIGPIAGMNNHEGSLITADRNLIGAVLDVCLDEKIIFLDSRTSSQTQAPLAAMERGMHIWERDIFLDNNPDPNEMRTMINKGLAIADKKGYAIMIGHVQTPALAKLLREMYADLQKQGYVFTTLSRMEKR